MPDLSLDERVALLERRLEVVEAMVGAADFKRVESTKPTATPKPKSAKP